MKTNAKGLRAQLRTLDAQAQALRAQLKSLDEQASAFRSAAGISDPRTVLTEWNIFENEAIIAVADGYGMATVSRIDRMGWDDQLLIKAYKPLTEERAIRLAELLAKRAGADIGD